MAKRKIKYKNPGEFSIGIRVQLLIPLHEKDVHYVTALKKKKEIIHIKTNKFSEWTNTCWFAPLDHFNN